MSEKRAAERISPEKLAAVTGGIGEYNPGGGNGSSDQPIDVALGWGDDQRDGTGANDTIQGQGGNDTIWAGDGSDKVFGDDGNDWLQGGRGSDEIHGGAGNDWIHGGTTGQAGDGAADRIFAGDGDDTIIWTRGSGNDEIHGQGGVDTLFLQGLSRDELFGALSTDNTNLMLKHEGNGIYSFVNRDGSPAHDVAGTFRINGETVRFYNMEKIRIG
jgi:Ca2+-binding RTX toxin-like protein